ncbi:MAG TPA: DUF308 domain-containing protein [Iamia sp.]
MANPSVPVLEVHRRPRADRWWIHLLVGAALAVLGIVLVLDPRAAASTLALLIGLALVIHGLDDLFLGRRGVGSVAGVASVVAGIVAMVWPDVTLWVLAVITGMAFIAVGSLKITTGFLARPEPGWGWVLAGGIASAVLGVLALTWPAATALVLALVLGLRTLMAGIAEIAFAVEAHRAATLR